MNNRQQTANRYVSNFEQQRAAIRQEVKALLGRCDPNKIDTLLRSLEIIKEAKLDGKNAIMQIVIEIGLLEMDSILAEWMAE